jgi:hypothetical protein
MTKQELDTLWELACKLRNERLEEIKKENNLTEDELQELVDDPYCEDLYDIDDGDNLIQGLDIVISVVEDMKPTE